MKTLSIQGCEKIEKTNQLNWPSHRLKLACCLKGFKLYVCGGDGFDSTDFWIYHTDTGEWTKLDCHGDAPKSLQSHSLHPDWSKNIIYIFGGSFGLDTPLWSFDIDSRLWTKIISDNGPSSRIGHEAILEKNCRYLHVFGGYINVIGSTSEHWVFDISNNTWVLKKEDNSPCARHDFGSISDNDDWWIFGGSRQLTILNDLWTYTFCSKQWTQIKIKKVPNPIYGHKLVRIQDTVLIIGGTNSSNSTWGFNIKKLKWMQITLPENMPSFLHHGATCIHTDGDMTDRNSRNSYCYWRKVKVSPSNKLDSPEYIGKVFVNRAFSIESQNYGRNFFNSYKFNAKSPRNSSDDLLLSNIDYPSENREIEVNGTEIEENNIEIEENNTEFEENNTEIETEFSEMPPDVEPNQILILGSHSSAKFCPLTMWKLTTING